ncbi:MAG: RimK family alpha-L-glutamate ligase [Hyphomicrobiaceae bacterium]
MRASRPDWPPACNENKDDKTELTMTQTFQQSVQRISGRPLRLALFVEAGGGDWHARQLRTAFEARGAKVVTTTLKSCGFDTRLPSGISIPGFDGSLPDGVFVRSISTGTLEQITLRLGILHALRESGVKVWNDARAIERCVDKSTATFFFQRAGLPVPTTQTAEGIGNARTFLGEQAAPCVSKPLFGSQGNGIRRIDSPEDLPQPDAVGDVYYMQRYLRRHDDTRFLDWRVFVSKHRVLGAMARIGTNWVTNIHQGAAAAIIDNHDDEELAGLALAAAEAIGVDYAGVDIIANADGDLNVLEINSNPAWKGLQSITDVNIAWTLAEDFLTEVCAKAGP